LISVEYSDGGACGSASDNESTQVSASAPAIPFRRAHTTRVSRPVQEEFIPQTFVIVRSASCTGACEVWGRIALKQAAADPQVRFLIRLVMFEDVTTIESVLSRSVLAEGSEVFGSQITAER
jgi:hypothetical protein